jgi:SAM-dependent methyltransferase
MQYDPIKKTLGRFFSGPVFMRKIFFFLLDLLLLRTWHVKRALRKISLNYPGQANVLDAGAGFGQYSWRMIRMNRNWKIKAIDIDNDHIEDCKRFFAKTGLSGSVSCEQGDLIRLSDTDLYNVILSVDVMEHILEDEIVFHNFYRVLKSNGVLLISTPSDKGGSDVHEEGDRSFIGEHVRDGYSIDEIKTKLLLAGFRDIRASYTYGKPGNLSWHLSVKYPVKMLGRSGFFFILLPFYYMIAFPFAILLNFLDLWINHRSGTGLLVKAFK